MRGGWRTTAPRWSWPMRRTVMRPSAWCKPPAAAPWRCAARSASPRRSQALAQAVEAQFGRCDILVNNAGIYPIQMFDEMTFADWRRLMAVNLDAQFLTIKAFAPACGGGTGAG